MSRKLFAALGLVAALALGFSPAPALAQLDNALVKPDCNSTTYPSGVTRQIVQTTAGLVCTSVSATGTFTDAATGVTGNPVPASASYTGVNVGGNTTGVTGTSDGGKVRAHVLAPDGANATGNITSTQSVTLTLTDGGYASYGFQISGTWTGTIVVEGTVDGTNFFPTTAVPLNGPSQGSFASNSAGQGSVAGLAAIRFRGSTVATGTAAITIRPSVGASAIMQDNLHWSTNLDQINGSPVATGDGGIPGTGAVVQRVALAYWTPSNITTNANTPIKSGLGVLHSITINSPGLSETATIFDNTSCTGTKMATVAVGTAPVTLTYDAVFFTGLCVTTAGSGAADITVSAR